MDLESLLFSQGFGSRRQCRALLLAGAVTVDGVPITDPTARIAPADFAFEVDGTRWLYREKVYLALNKPAGYECSREPQHHDSVFSLLPEPLRTRAVQCVGRLDQDTTGLLLLSDDGAFVHRYTSPKRKVGKRYRVRLKHPADAGLEAALRQGVVLRDDPTPRAAQQVARIAPDCIEMTITEGKYHQVKRMIAAAGNRVEALHRSAIGGFALPEGLAPGDWLYLDATQLAALGAPA